MPNLNKYLIKSAVAYMLDPKHKEDVNNLNHELQKGFPDEYRKEYGKALQSRARNTVVGHGILGSGIGALAGGVVGHGHPGITAAGAGAGALIGGGVGYLRRHNDKNKAVADFVGSWNANTHIHNKLLDESSKRGWNTKIDPEKK